MLAIVALDLDSEEYKSKLKQIQTTHGSKGKKQSIQLKVREHNLPIEETKAKVIEGKKGLLQVLWEQHGFIDEWRLESYSLIGWKAGCIWICLERFSLKSLMGNCLDFEEEETLLQ